MRLHKLSQWFMIIVMVIGSTDFEKVPSTSYIHTCIYTRGYFVLLPANTPKMLKYL